jgi:hypothetical protein
MSDYTEELTMSDAIFPWSPDATILAAWTVKWLLDRADDPVFHAKVLAPPRVILLARLQPYFFRLYHVGKAFNGVCLPHSIPKPVCATTAGTYNVIMTTAKRTVISACCA